MRIRQVVVAASDLRATRTVIEDSLNLPHVWADPGVAAFGLRNALYAVGDCFLEVVSPFTDDAPAARFIARRGGDAGYMLIVQTDEDLDAVAARAVGLGVRVVHRARTAGIEGLHLHPADTGGTLLSIDRPDDPAAWPWAGPAWEAAPERGWREVAEAEVAVADPATTAARWHRLFDRCDLDGDTLVLDRGRIRFVPRAGDLDGLSGFTFAATRPHDPVVIAGTTITTTVV